jgi:hypothetical protein
MPFPRSPRGLTLPDTPNPTPEDSAHTMGGRSPMLSGAGGLWCMWVWVWVRACVRVRVRACVSAESC